MIVDDKGWLVGSADEPAVEQLPTVRTYPLAVPSPLGFVWHTTDERGGPGYAEALARRIQGFRQGVDRAASWHLLIARDGTIYQSAPITVGTWHVGLPGVIAGRRFPNVNHATVGCELENAGRLRRLGDQAYCWPYFVNPGAPPTERRPDPRCAVPLDRAVATKAGLFDGFTAEQEASAVVVVHALVTKFDWSRDVCAYGHVDFDPQNREDPGPVWTLTYLPRVLDRAFGHCTTSATADTAG